MLKLGPLKKRDLEIWGEPGPQIEFREWFGRDRRTEVAKRIRVRTEHSPGAERVVNVHAPRGERSF